MRHIPALRLGVPRSAVPPLVGTRAQYTVAQAVNKLRQLAVANLPDVMLITDGLARDGRSCDGGV